MVGHSGWVILARINRHSDPQQTGFKGNLRLLIKPFEQPHLPFKILSAALHEPPASRCHLLLPPPAAASRLSVLELAAFSSAHTTQNAMTLAFSFRPPEWITTKKWHHCAFGFLFVLLILCRFFEQKSLMIAHGRYFLVVIQSLLSWALNMPNRRRAGGQDTHSDQNNRLFF